MRRGSPTPPNNLELEAAVLGTCVLRPETLDTLQLGVGDFYSSGNSRIFAALHELRLEGVSIDALTVKARLKRNGHLDEAGGAAYLPRLLDANPADHNVQTHAGALVQLSARRKLIAEMQTLAAEGYGDDVAEEWFSRVADVATRVEARASNVDPIEKAWKPFPVEVLTTLPRPRRWLLVHPDGTGLLPMGKGGMFTAEGGAGKTTALIALAVSVITGRPWFGHFPVGLQAHGGRVLLALAEEEHEDVTRKLFGITAALNLSDEEQAAVVDRIVALPLAGEPVSLVMRTKDGEVEPTATLRKIERKLRADPGGGWALVVLDPLSRWAGLEVETENAVATRFVQIAERLTKVPGCPTVLVAHHTSKDARKNGKADSRGVTGLTDGFRWAATLRDDAGAVYFRQTKSNYSRPMREELELVRGDEGILRAPSAVEAENTKRSAEQRELDRATEELDTNVKRVVEGMQLNPTATSVDQIVTRAGLRSSVGRVAVREALSRGLILQSGSQKDRTYQLGTSIGTSMPLEVADSTLGRPPYGQESARAETPHTPRDVGTSTSGPWDGRKASSDGRPGRLGTAWDVGTSIQPGDAE